MQQKSKVIINRGMNRDLSISKTDNSSVYENHNIRITANNHDTLLSVTNEMGTSNVLMVSGDFVGANTLDKYIILFTHSGTTDRITRIDTSTVQQFNVYTGNIGLSQSNPIESVVYYETESIQKIYWVDGINPLRCANIMQTYTSSSGVDDIFDVNKSVKFVQGVVVSKTNSGNSRPNGVVQYLVTYHNKHGQETGFVWVSDIVYLSPSGRGGAADEYNSNSVSLTFPANSLDTSFDYFRIYSLFRSSLDGEVYAALVSENDTTTSQITIVDDGAHQEVQDFTRLLYLGSDAVIASTIEQKDNALFLGNFSSIGRSSATELENQLSSLIGSDGISNAIQFQTATAAMESTYGVDRIEYVTDTDIYPYHNQLSGTSSTVTTFKSGEKYRFALRFQYADGKYTDAYWIGDRINTTRYPYIRSSTGKIERAFALLTLPSSLISYLNTAGYKRLQIMIAEATDADRSIKAQGIVNPTMFNVWERYNNRIYSVPSWISRPIGADYAYEHFAAVDKSTNSTGEIQCNYWEDDKFSHPYYTVGETYPTSTDYNYVMATYAITREHGSYNYKVAVNIIKAYGVVSGHEPDVKNFQFPSATEWTTGGTWDYEDPSGNFRLQNEWVYASGFSLNRPSKSRPEMWADLNKKLSDKDLEELVIPYEGNSGIKAFCEDNLDHPSDPETLYINVLYEGTATYYNTQLEALNAGSNNSDRWEDAAEIDGMQPGPYAAAYYRKNTMFVDTNVVTLDSPEIYYNTSVADNAEYKFRLVGVARNTSVMSDYIVNATSGRLSGSNLDAVNFTRKYSAATTIAGIISWPLWREYGLIPKESGLDPKEATDADYGRGNSIVHYWMHMWQRQGSIDGWNGDGESKQYGILDTKTFANSRICYDTEYFLEPIVVNGVTVRIADEKSASQVSLPVFDGTKYYSAKPRMQLTMPGKVKYPVLYSNSVEDPSTPTSSSTAFLYANDPVTIEYTTTRHAVITLPTTKSGSTYNFTTLPILSDTARSYSTVMAAKLPWFDNAESNTYELNKSECVVRNILGEYINPTEPYLFIGEIYREFGSGSNDTRYGGPTKEAAENNRYVAASEWITISPSMLQYVPADRGDTYIQRYDALRVRPYSNDSVNKVIDITSVLLETHINIDGRTDLQRGITEIASIDNSFNSINPVYSQKDNFISGRDLDEDANIDRYKTAITWTLPKKELADTDEWMHITLANSLLLDGDRGECRSLCRYNNSLIAFQDTGISEILYNSRTQLSTTSGVPVEVANSGKVDGKRYITTKYGCINKWSIVEGKKGLYFVDTDSNQLCRLSGNGIDNLSERLGLSVWFRRKKNANIWNPATHPNFISFFDNRKNDVYLSLNETTNTTDACISYNENIDTFTSFFDYGSVSYMTNTPYGFYGIKKGSTGGTRLWKMQSSLYGYYFGAYKDYWVTYRVAPNNVSDRIWTNIGIRADFYETLTGSAGYDVIDKAEDSLIDGGEAPNFVEDYIPNEHFSRMDVWNEYQQASVTSSTADNPIKKFRVWRYQIPRAIQTTSNVYGSDRIRNPWIFVKFTKTFNGDSDRYLMQLHDAEFKYYE